jgi:hypothetical protein
MILSLIEGENPDIMEKLISFINHKVLETTLLHTFKKLLSETLLIDTSEKNKENFQNLDPNGVIKKLTKLYIEELGENIQKSIL